MLISISFVLIFAFLAGNQRNTPTASAYHGATQYDLCTRTPQITALILTELRDDWGADNSDTRYDAASGFGCDTGQSAVISAADLLAHTEWESATNRMLIGSSFTSVKSGDFAGLNLKYINFWYPNITEIPARLFEGTTVPMEDVDFSHPAQLERIHPDAFDGLLVADNRFIFRLFGQSKLTHETVPPTVFDPLGDQGFDDATANVQHLELSGPNISHINTRWFASLARTGQISWEAIDLALPWTNPGNIGGRGIYDTYYYDDGDGRFTDGSETTRGEISITPATTKATIGTAISAEIKRYADAKTGTTFTVQAGSGVATATTIRNFGQGADGVAPFEVDRTFWGSVDLCARTPAVRDAILTELRTEQPTVYGTAADHSSGTYSTTANFDCTLGAASDSAIVTKANLTAHTDWTTNATRLNITSKNLTKLRFDDLRYLNAPFIDISSNAIEKLPDGLFSGLAPERIYFWRTGLREFGSNVLHGINTTATGGVLITLEGNKLTDVSIAHDAFDHFTNVQQVALSNNRIGRVNTRWFQRLTNLGSGASWLNLIMSGNPVVAYFDNDTGGYYDTGATNKADYDPAVAADATALQQAISAKIAAYATATDGVTDNSDLTSAGKFVAPDGYGIEPCERNPAVWKELMRQFQYIRDDLAEAAGAWPVWPVDLQIDIGDIRPERYANITKSQCVVLEAHWVNPATGAPIADQSAPNTATDKLAIKDDASFGQLSQHFRLDRLDLSTLVPADLANMHAVQRIWMNNTRLQNLNAGIFADMPKLTHLNLANNRLDTADLDTSNILSGLDNLVQLNLSGNLLTEFDSDWLSSDARDGLRELYIGDNPIATTDMTGLNLSNLEIHLTSIIELDPAISDMTNLRNFHWWGLRALPIDGYEDFLEGLPSGLILSNPDQFGNPGDLEDAELDQAAVGVSLAHNAKIAAINAAGGGNQVTTIQLVDPCRPTLGGTRADWEAAYGDLCLTASQKDAFISSIDNFNAASHFTLYNSDFSDAQMATLLGKLAAQDNVYGIQFNGNPSAFGTGFNNAALSAFSQFGGLWLLHLRNHDLDNAQADSILRNLEGALARDRSYTATRHGITAKGRGGVTILDLSHNPMLFKTPDSTDPSMMVDVDPDDLHTFIRGIMPSNEGSGFSLSLQDTDINFDQLRAVLWSIENGRSPTNLWNIGTLNLADNPNLWKRPSSGAYVDVTADEIEALLAQFAGVKNVYLGNTGITSQAMLEAVHDGLNTAPNADKSIDPRDTSALERLTEYWLTGNDLSAITAAELEAGFAKLATRNALTSPQLVTLSLGDTSITLAQLTGIVDGLATADLLDGVLTLDISNNPGLYTGCTTGEATDALAALVARFTNLRNVDVSGSQITFTQLSCVVKGMTPGNAVSIKARDNADLFTGVDKEDVGELLAPFTYTSTDLVNTGLTPAQASEIATQRAAMAQSDAERRETERRTAAQNPTFAFKTPLPDDTTLQSGRGSLRVAFTHDPMYGGAAFNVLRYEYRYRVRPTDAGTDWGSGGTEAWRTASLDLTSTGAKTFDIFGLETETVYQVQLRATSVARPNILTLTGGTSINLPEINSIKPTITEINMRAGDTVRLEVNIYGLADFLNNALYGKTGSKLFFTWSDDSSGGTFADPNDQRRVNYTAPGLPGTYKVMAEAGPDGICADHHKTNFGITDADRADCQATITVRVSRAQTPAEPEAEPINPAGPIPSALTDPNGAAYDVFTPVEGGIFTGTGITVTAAKGAVPDRQLIGVAAAASTYQAPDATPGARMTIAGRLYDIRGVNANGQPVSAFTLDEPLTACIPLPEAFRANISDVVIVERKGDGSYGILSSKLRQSSGELNVCGGVSTLPATIGVAKLGIVPQPPATPVPDDIETPETGATAPSYPLILLTLIVGVLSITAINRIRRITQRNP